MTKKNIPKIIGVALMLGLTTALLSCTSTSPYFVLDKQSYQAQGKDERIKFVILHYTAETDEVSLYKLTHEDVSAHYVIPKTDDDIIYQLVADEERAWHAGRGGFAGRRGLNDTSIGIEVVNLGIQPQYIGITDPVTGYHPAEHYVDYNDIQVAKIGQLIQDLTARYHIKPQHILGHSDIAPNRKIDPGAKFPWERLYKEYGVGAWYDEADKQRFMTDGSFKRATIFDIKQALRDYGYQIDDIEINGINEDKTKLATDEWDRKSRNVIYAFQLHFRSDNPNGVMDNETYAILQALNFKYGEVQ